MLRTRFEKDEISGLIEVAVVVGYFAFNHQELFVARVLMRLAGASRFHPIDVKSRPGRKCIVELKEALSGDRLSIDKKRCEWRGADIGHEALFFFILRIAVSD